jgi:paraquat-inducible protein B
MTELREVPQAQPVQRSRWSFQAIWLVPLVALLIGGWLVVKTYMEQGPTITVTFKNAEGIEAGKTKLRYRDVEVGLVKDVRVSREGVVAAVAVAKGAEQGLVEDTRFWLVRPRIAGGSVSGLGTLLSGVYIGVDPGKSAKRRNSFIALEKPPVISGDMPGRQYTLKSATAGSLDLGAPVYLRKVPVGQVSSFALAEDGRGVVLTVFVNSPFDRHVTPSTRFWHSSGIDVSLDASGLKVRTEGLMSIAIGGISFAPSDDAAEPAANEGHAFILFTDQEEANRKPDSVVDTYQMVFTQSVRGLVRGAPLDYRGIIIGEVAGIYTRVDPKNTRGEIVVEAHVYPERFASRRREGDKEARLGSERTAVLKMLVDNGLRAQLRTGNLLTGQLYIALEHFPRAAKVKFDPSSPLPEIPTVPGAIEDLQLAVSSIAKKLDQVPFDRIAADLDKTIVGINRLVGRMDEEIVPVARETLEESRETVVALRGTLAHASRALAVLEGSAAPDAPLQQDIRDAVREVGRSAHSMRALADYLERHPESLLRGKSREGP